MVYAFLKWALSFTKSEWGINDYPLRYRFQGGQTIGEIKVPNWSVQVINWYTLNGLGETKEEAFADLCKNFERKKETSDLPRPGAKVPLEYAPCVRIKQYEEIVRQIIRYVFDIDYDQCFISDESTLGDFRNDEVRKETIVLIKERFNVDISECQSGNIADIAELISKAKRA